jgi:rhodanese-related sulfurtransferase
MMRNIERDDVQKMVSEGAQLVEVLGPREYETEHLPGAINIPLKNLGPEARRQLDPRRPVILYCYDYQ